MGLNSSRALGRDLILSRRYAAKAITVMAVTLKERVLFRFPGGLLRRIVRQAQPGLPRVLQPRPDRPCG